MKDARHTPGPWTYDPSEIDARSVGYIRHRIHDGGRGEAVARALGRRDFGPTAFDANARLIAAAPDLLACCEATLAYMRRRLDRDEDLADDVLLLEEAIKKARGGA